jgi:hypothetical protein
MKISVPTMGTNTDFKGWKRNFLTFLSLKAEYLIPQHAIHESCVWLDEQAQYYAIPCCCTLPTLTSALIRRLSAYPLLAPAAPLPPGMSCVSGWMGGPSPVPSPS